MSINVWGYLAEYERDREAILEIVDSVFRSGQLILGPHVRQFEEEFARYHEADLSCVGVDNGTNALVLALRSLGVGPGDEVITVSNTAAPTVVAIDSVGATPVFVDVDEHLLMDLTQLRAAITPRTTCIVPVHLYGQCVAMDDVMAIADEFGLSVVEDVAQAHGARHRGRMAGTWGDAAAYSFYPTKVLGAYGDGGAVLTPQAATADRLRQLRYYGMESTYYVTSTPGHNSRLDEVQAAILRHKLARLDTDIAARRQIADRYQAGLGGSGLRLPVVAPGNEHVYYVYVVRHPMRDALLDRLRARDINLNISYPWPVHTMTGFARLGYEVGSLPETELAATEVFSLPMYPTLGRDDQDRTIETVLACLDEL